ncbi:MULTISPECIES: Uma2 family endonuclease [unclassified Meiothermus]|uniref:Uma2 family endonuclease n=1 Tax=unclassified Meiothermus TaxID=370471 RepID=UPI000D7CB8D1|nr:MULTISPECIES: Uma2 family endonuclease [unclassified Meiothermus]PZA08427.1 Uma2 family endonuclease [Meiothermus sp. Pnk-1]RYM37096.1 Uma2 family endonuclease [Meiothermus sp. PNK-Is4]
MARQNPVRQATFEEYLEFEQHSQVRHEFVDGYLFAMAGGTDFHNRISGRLYRLILDAAETADCDLFINDMILQTPSGRGYYPDLFLTCEERSDGSRFKRFPCWIIEVLSESTEAIDRGEKLHSYKAIPSLNAYILVSQDQRLVEVYRRLEDGTWRYETLEGNDVLELPCLELKVGLEEIYRGVGLA